MTDTDTLDLRKQESLVQYLYDQGLVGGAEVLDVQVLSDVDAPASHLSVRVRLDSGRTWVVKQALLPEPASELIPDPARIGREAAALEWLARHLPGTAPAPVMFDAARHVLIMESVPEPHDNLRGLLLDGRTPDPDVVRLTGAFGRLLGRIHRVAAQTAPDETRRAFQDTRFFESLRLVPGYAATADRVPAAADFLAHLLRDTRARQLTLVHGDYTPRNVLVRSGGEGGRLVLLGPELTHWGDPAFDVGHALSHLVAKANHVRGRTECYRKAAGAFWQAYRSEAAAVPGLIDEPLCVRHLLASLLAQARGRSPLAYLPHDVRDRQTAATLALISQSPERLEGTIDRFLKDMK